MPNTQMREALEKAGLIKPSSPSTYIEIDPLRIEKLSENLTDIIYQFLTSELGFLNTRINHQHYRIEIPRKLIKENIYGDNDNERISNLKKMIEFAFPTWKFIRYTFDSKYFVVKITRNFFKQNKISS